MYNQSLDKTKMTNRPTAQLFSQPNYKPMGGDWQSGKRQRLDNFENEEFGKFETLNASLSSVMSDLGNLCQELAFTHDYNV